MSEEQDAISEAARAMGRKGGAAGTGEAKRRSKEHYSKAANTRWDKYRAEQKEEAGQEKSE